MRSLACLSKRSIGRKARIHLTQAAASLILHEVQSEAAKFRSREAGAVALVADDDDSKVVAHVGEVVLARRVHSPFEDVAVDCDRAGQFAVSVSLFEGPDVDDQRSSETLMLEGAWLDAVESGAGGSEDLVDRVPLAAQGVHRGWVSYMRTATTRPDAAVRMATA